MKPADGLRPARKPAPGARLNSAHPLTMNLLLCYLCHEGSGSRVRDSRGRYHATITTPATVTWGQGNMGGKALLSAATTATTLGLTVPAPVTPASWAIETWVVVTAQSETADAMLWGDNANYGLFVRREPGMNSWRLNFYTGTTRLSTNFLPLHRLTQVVLTGRGTANVDLYINGRLDTAYALPPATLTWGIMLNDAGSQTFNGRLDVARLWRRQLTPGEVSSLYRQPFAMFQAPHLLIQRPAPAAPADRTGTATLTQASQALQASAMLATFAQAALTQSSQTLQASGVLELRTSASLVQSDQTLQASGALALLASASLGQSDQTLQASGTSAAVAFGTVSLAQASQTVQASGALALRASASLVQSGQTLQASGTISTPSPSIGTVALTQASQTLQASGTAEVVSLGAASLGQESQALQASATLALRASAGLGQSSQTLVAESFLRDPPAMARGYGVIAGFAHESAIDGSQWPASSAAAIHDRWPLLEATFDAGVQQTPVVTRAHGRGPSGLDLVFRYPSVRVRFRWRYQGLEALLACALGYMPATYPQSLGTGVSRHLYEISPDLASEPWPVPDGQPAGTRLVRRGTFAAWRQVSVWELVSGMVQTLTLQTDGMVVTGEVVLLGARLRQRGTVNTRESLRALPPCPWPTVLAHHSVLWLGERSRYTALTLEDAMCYSALELRLENQLEATGSRRTGLEPEECIRRGPPQLTLTATVPRYAVDTWLDAWLAQQPMMGQLRFTGQPIGTSPTPYQQTWYLPSLAWSAATPGPLAPGLPQVQYSLLGTVTSEQAAGMPLLTQPGPLGLELICGVPQHPLL